MLDDKLIRRMTRAAFDGLPTRRPSVLTLGACWRERRAGVWFHCKVIPDPAGRRLLWAVLVEEIELTDGTFPEDGPHQHTMRRIRPARRTIRIGLARSRMPGSGRGGFSPGTTAHYHSGLALMTPEMVHYGAAERVRAQRQ